MTPLRKGGSDDDHRLSLLSVTYVRSSVLDTHEGWQAITLKTPFKGTGAALLPTGKFLENVLFAYRETAAQR